MALFKSVGAGTSNSKITVHQSRPPSPRPLAMATILQLNE
jgi:hypothetical protein